MLSFPLLDVLRREREGKKTRRRREGKKKKKASLAHLVVASERRGRPIWHDERRRRCRGRDPGPPRVRGQRERDRVELVVDLRVEKSCVFFSEREKERENKPQCALIPQTSLAEVQVHRLISPPAQEASLRRRSSARTLSLFATGEEEPAFARAFRFVTVAAASPPRPEGPASPSRASMNGEALKGSSFTCDDEEKEEPEAGVRACGKRPGARKSVVELKKSGD